MEYLLNVNDDNNYYAMSLLYLDRISIKEMLVWCSTGTILPMTGVV